MDEQTSGAGEVAAGPSLRDLVTILSRPRETLRRILGARSRWTWEVIVLASVCSSYLDPDFRRVRDLTLSATVAIAVVAIVVNALVWVGLSYVFAWAATQVGRRLEGSGSFADVRTAIAWGLVPQIWSIVFRVPASLYAARFITKVKDNHQQIAEFIGQGGCSAAIVFFTIQLLLYILIVYVESNTLAEALHFSPGRGLATLAITSAIPLIVAVAALIAMRT